MNRVMYREWFPQIVYNHHQTGPAGTVVFIPPCRDPFNYNIDPLVINGIEARQHQHGAALSRRRQARGHRAHRAHVFHLVQRRPVHDLPVPQHDRPFHRDHRRPDAGADSAACRTSCCPTAIIWLPLPRRNGTSGSRWTTPCRATSRCSTTPRATASICSTTSGVMGKNAIDAGNRDSWTVTPKIVEAAGGGSDGGGGRRRFGKGSGGRRPRNSNVSSTTRPNAIRAATSSRPTRPISSPRRSSSTPCWATASRCIAPRRISRSPARNTPSGSYVVKIAPGVPRPRARHV